MSDPVETDTDKGLTGMPVRSRRADPGLAPRRERLVAGRFSSQLTPGPLRRAVLRVSQARLDTGGAVARAFETERETGSLFNFVPVCFGLGILTYFSIPSEPVAGVVWASAAVVVAIAWRLQTRGAVHLVLVATALFLAGMGAAQWRTAMVSGPAIERMMTAQIEGRVLERDANSRGSPRYVIRLTAVEGLAPGQLPERVRLSASAGKLVFEPGEAIAGKARIMPINGPAYPGGYDFGFFARYDRLGGTGFFLGAPHAGQTAVANGWRETAGIGLNRLRQAIGARIHAGLAGEPGDIATALITGDRSGIDAATSDSLRRSGLAHVLAISGLHMALVALTVVWGLRWALAWSPALALDFPIAKWAAGAGLAAATVYLTISGASVATQRAWVMIAVMLTAALADRRAVTIRNVAIAALVILILAPESLLEPGFQMSFAAAAALVAAYQALREHGWRRMSRNVDRQQGRLARLAGSVPAYFGGLVFTSLIAGLATGLFAAWHFQRVAPLGLLANALAMPVVTTLVMPFALISTLAMPYGLERPFLAVLGWGIERMVAISDWVNGFGMDGVTGIQPLAMLGTGALALVLLTSLRTRLRVVGLAPLALLPFLAGSGETPDILAAEDGRTVAVADNAGRLVPLYPRRNRFVTDIWLRAWSGGTAGDGEGVIGERCDRDLCVAKLRGGQVLHVVYDPDLLQQACEQADILLMPRLKWLHCKGRWPALVLKRGDFEAGGSQMIRLARTDDGKTAFDVIASRQAGNRPWNMSKLEDPDAERTAGRHTGSKAPTADRQSRPRETGSAASSRSSGQ